MVEAHSKSFSLFIAFLLLMVSAASAGQLPLPVDAAQKAGLPAYTLANSNIVGDRGDRTVPEFADLDADGDYDMVLGLYTGILEYWRNDGSNV